MHAWSLGNGTPVHTGAWRQEKTGLFPGSPGCGACQEDSLLPCLFSAHTPILPYRPHGPLCWEHPSCVLPGLSKRLEAGQGCSSPESGCPRAGSSPAGPGAPAGMGAPAQTALAVFALHSPAWLP